jgi:hypothetical protein
VVGYTWWGRVLGRLAVPHHRTIELEDFFHSAFPLAPVPELHTAAVVADMLRLAVAEAARRHHPGGQLDGGFVARAAISRGLRPRMLTPPGQGGVLEGEVLEGEVLEVRNSFRPEGALYFTVERMEQVLPGGVGLTFRHLL